MKEEPGNVAFLDPAKISFSEVNDSCRHTQLIRRRGFAAMGGFGGEPDGGGPLAGAAAASAQERRAAKTEDKPAAKPTSFRRKRTSRFNTERRRDPDGDLLSRHQGQGLDPGRLVARLTRGAARTMPTWPPAAREVRLCGAGARPPRATATARRSGRQDRRGEDEARPVRGDGPQDMVAIRNFLIDENNGGGKSPAAELEQAVHCGGRHGGRPWPWNSPATIGT